MTQVRGGIVILSLLLAGCPGLRAEMAKSLRDDRDGTRERPVTLPAQRESADPAHYAIVAYEVCSEATAAAEELLKKKKSLEPAGERLKQVIRLGGEALGRIEREKASGVWQAGLKYPTESAGPLPAEELVARLTRMRDAAQRTWDDTVGPAIFVMLKKKYQARSSAQADVLEQLGRPESQTVTPRGERCWVFNADDKRLTYCWDRRGQLARRTLADRVEGGPSTPALPMTLAQAAAARPRPAPPPPKDPAPASPPAATAPAPATPAAQPQGTPAAQTTPAAQAQAPASAPAASPSAPSAASRLTPQQLALLRYAADALAAGACDDRSCVKRGWTLRVGAAQVQVRCAAGGCQSEGWVATLPGGEQSRTTCIQSDCLREGWATTLPDRSRTETVCNFNDCWKDGWATTAPGKGRITSSCERASCGKIGWTALLPGGQSVRCRCIAQSCADNGAECN
jgi:hypothetical protein